MQRKEQISLWTCWRAWQLLAEPLGCKVWLCALPVLHPARLLLTTQRLGEEGCQTADKTNPAGARNPRSVWNLPVKLGSPLPICSLARSIHTLLSSWFCKLKVVTVSLRVCSECRRQVVTECPLLCFPHLSPSPIPCPRNIPPDVGVNPCSA